MDNINEKIKLATKIQNLRELLNEEAFFCSETQIHKTEKILATYLCRMVLEKDFEVLATNEEIKESVLDIDTLADKIRAEVSEYIHRKAYLNEIGQVEIKRRL